MADSVKPVEKTFRWKYKSESDAKRARKEKERIRQLSRINIGNQAGRWSAVKSQLGIQTHAAFAKLLLDRFFQTEREQNKPTQPKLDVCSSTESCESVHSDDEFMSSFEEQDTFSPIPGQELEQTDAPRQNLMSSDEVKAAKLSENNKIRVGDDEEEKFSASLSVGDGCYQVDLRSSSELVVDEQCILELFQSCRQCHRRCLVRKRVAGLKIVINQKCGYCPNRFEWTNLPDDKNNRNDSPKKAQNTAMLPS